VFASRGRFSGSADLMVPLSMTLSDPEPQFQLSRSQYSISIKGEYLANGESDPLDVWFQARVFGVGGSNGAISGSIIPKMAVDGHLGMTALSRVTLASAGLSCLFLVDIDELLTHSISPIIIAGGLILIYDFLLP